VTAPAKPRRRSRDYSPEEVAALMDPLAPVSLERRPPQFPSLPPVAVPPWVNEVPRWVRGQGLEHLIAKPGSGDPGPPLQTARRLTVVARDELDEGKLEERTFEFVPDYGGCVVVYGGGRGPDPLDPSAGCQGRFSPFASASMELLPDPVRLVVVEGPDAIERVIVVDELAPQSVHVEVVRPDEREPWVLKATTESFRLDRVLSLSLEDAP
jgi:hypothetical protein